MSEAAKSVRIALLRGINVGRAKRIAMADLRDLFEELGFLDVQTLLNSGNVVFRVAGKAGRGLANELQAAIRDTLGVDASVLVLTASELQTVIDENRLVKVATNHSRLLVSLWRDAKDRARLETLAKQKWGDDEFQLGTRAAYSWCSAGILGSDLPAAVERALDGAVTSRNWATILKLQAKVEQG